SGILGGLIAYAAATAVVAMALLWPPLRQNVIALKRENVLWFVNSGVFVALAQGLFYAAVAVAPIMLVAPLLQLSLVFRLTFFDMAQPRPRGIRPAGHGRGDYLDRWSVLSLYRYQCDPRCTSRARIRRPDAALADLITP